jgi:hypothetical protein
MIGYKNEIKIISIDYSFCFYSFSLNGILSLSFQIIISSPLILLKQEKQKKMARTSTQKIKIGVHWKNSVSIGISSSNSPRHPKLIELDPVSILPLYFNLTRTFIGHCTRCLYFTNMR